MILALSTDPIRHVPAWRQGDPAAPAFFIRPGNVLERGQLEAELAGEHRAGQVYSFELEQAVSEGLTELLADDPEGLDEMLALVAAEAEDARAEAAAREAGRAAPPPSVTRAAAQKLREAREVLAEHWPDYRALIAQLVRRRSIAPLVAFRRFVVGWEGVEPPFARGMDGLVRLDAMTSLSPLDLRMVGEEAYRLLYAGHQAGNCAAPSRSDEGRRTSSSDAPLAQDGSSPAAPGPKTRD